MTQRISTSSIYQQILLGIRFNTIGSIRAQEQLSSGRRILRPSDDPTGAARALSLDRQIEDVSRYTSAVGASRGITDAGGSALQEASGLLSGARSLVVQALSGTLNDGDRKALKSQFELFQSQLLEIANQKNGERYLFAGTETSSAPWHVEQQGALRRFVYSGNGEEQKIRVGSGVDVPVGVPGSELFGKSQSSGTSFGGYTGIAGGTTADQGTGYVYLDLRHDATDLGGLSGVGIAAVNGGSDDTALGPSSITVDPTAGTIQLGSGPAVSIPGPTDPARADLVVANGKGGEVHLDLSGYTGTAYTGTVTGAGSVSLDGKTYRSLSFTETDLELHDPATDTVLHVDATGVGRSGKELVTFSGTVNAFDTIQGVLDDLTNADGLPAGEIQKRLSSRLDELDRNLGNVQLGIGVLGSRSQRLDASEQRLGSLDLQLQTLKSNVVDADIAEVALDLARADRNLQAAQASGARIIQQSLLNYL